MRTLRAIGLVTLGMFVGVGFVAGFSSDGVQAQSVKELNARFAVSEVELAVTGSRTFAFRFLKDKQTGDCYLADVGAATGRAILSMTKTDSGACSGF